MVKKLDLIKQVAANTGNTRVITTKIVDEFLKELKENVISGEGVSLAKLFTLEVVEVPERMHINPQNGSKVLTPAHKTVKAKISSSFKNAVKAGE